MSIDFWVDGRLDWVLFGIVVYSLVGLLVLDYVWRLVNMRAVVLLPLTLGVWFVAGVVIGLWVVGVGW